jgi:hypothetical protein
MVILSLCGDKYSNPSDKPEDLTLLDRAWKRAVAHFKQGNTGRVEIVQPPAGAGTAA